MNITPAEYRCRLINGVLLASSLEEVKNQINSAMKNLQQNKILQPGIAGFVEKTIEYLNQFNTPDHSMQQWANIYYSKMEFQKIMDAMKESELIH